MNNAIISFEIVLISFYYEDKIALLLKSNIYTFLK